jgi:hypothetical protein
LVTHPEIASGQAHLTSEFFIIGVQKKKVYLGGMRILSILLTLELGCHKSTPLRRPMTLLVNPKAGTSPLDHNGMSNTGILIPYVQLAAYVPYHVPPRGPTCNAYVPTSLTCMLPYPSQLADTFL